MEVAVSSKRWRARQSWICFRVALHAIFAPFNTCLLKRGGRAATRPARAEPGQFPCVRTQVSVQVRDLAAYEAWKKVGFAPEVRLMEALREIEGITVVEAQSFIANQ